MENREKTTAFLQEFENHFDPAHIETSPVAVKVLGYGEISTVVAFADTAVAGWAFKRLPLYSSAKEAEAYCDLYLEYNRLLHAAGVDTPESAGFVVKGKNRFVAYLTQKQLPVETIGNRVIQTCSPAEGQTLLRMVLAKMRGLWLQNNDTLRLGLDSQISNWALTDYRPGAAVDSTARLLYLDTSTPFIRKNGVEQMNPLLFLQSAPPLIRPVLRKFFLQDVMDRFYDFRLTAIDLTANLYKEQKPEWIPLWLEVINSENQDLLQGKLITENEVEKFYKEDKFIWQLFLAVRRANRFINTKILGQRYEFTLPGKIKR
jgi:hypothetical protein